MRPAGSVIVFTALSGAGLGLLMFLLAGIPRLTGGAAFGMYFAGYGLTVGGLLSSVLHLTRPARARFSFSQWATSWLSREGVLSVAALLVAAPAAIAQIFLGQHWLAVGIVAAALCFCTVISTSMIYASLRAVPRWNMPWTPVLFVTQSLAGGALLAMQGPWAAGLLALLGVVQIVVWVRGDRRFAEVGATLASATGQPAGTPIRLFEKHTARDWVSHEMVYAIARKHARKLRVIGFTLLVVLPLAVVLLAPASVGATVLAAALHIGGALVCRWLFFAEAEHVVGLYFGR